jgi:hypothetical protein
VKQSGYVAFCTHSLGYQQSGATVLIKYNQGAIKYAKSGERGSRMRHIDIKHYFIREKVLDGSISLVYHPSPENPADIRLAPNFSLIVKPWVSEVLSP